MLVVGTRGRNPVKGFLLGSISRYCLHHSPIPVVVVRPERKLNKSKTKAKGIFRRRSSVFLEMQQGFQGPRVPHHQQQGLHISAADTDIKGAGSSNNSTVSSLPGLGLFQSATIAVTETPNKKNSFLSASRSASSSLFASLSTSPQQSGGFAPGSPLSTASSPSSSIVSFTTNNPHGQSPYGSSSKPPEGMLKLKKSVTVDGGSSTSLSSKLSGRGFSKSMLLGPLSLGRKDKKDDKDSGMQNRRASGG